MEPLIKKFNRVIEEGKGVNTQVDLKGESFSKKFAGKLLSTAGNLFRGDFEDSSLPQSKSAQPQIDLKDISDTLIKQNYQLKTLAENQQKEIEELKDQVEMMTDLEQNAHNENENLKYQLLSLKHGDQEPDSQHKEQKSKVLEQIKDLKLQKREQGKEIDELKQQIQSYKDLIKESSRDQGESVNDPVLMLKQLNMLYAVNKEELSVNDNTNIFISLLMKDMRVYTHYKQKLFQKITKQALDTSEFLCKFNSGVQSGPQIQHESKIYKENKSLKLNVKELQSKLDHQKKYSQNLQALLDQRDNISLQKFEQLKQKLKKAQNQIANIKGSFFQIRNEQEDLQEFGKQIIQPNLQLLLYKLKQSSAQNSKNLQEARKAVFEKNKQISDLSLKNSELQKQLTDGQQNNQLIYQKNKQIGDLFNQQKQLQQEIQEYKEMCENYQDQCNMLKQKLSQDSDKESGKVQEMKQREGKLQKEIEDLKHQIKEMKHIEVVKSLMKNDSSQVNQEVETARKSVLEKNKVISEMFNKQNELMQLIQKKDDEIMNLKKKQQVQLFTPSYDQAQVSNEFKPEQDFFGGFFKGIWNQAQNLTQSDNRPQPVNDYKPIVQTQYPPKQVPVQQNRDQHLNFNFQEQSEEEVEKKLKIVEEQYQTDSPSKIFHLQEQSHSQPVLRTSISHHEPPKKEVSFKDVTMTHKVLESNNIFVPDNNDDFFESIKKLSPPKEKENEKKESLDFLNDMFSGLIGNTVSQTMAENKKVSTQKEEAKAEAEIVDKGWEEDNELDIDVEFEKYDKIEISSDKQGFGLEAQVEQTEAPQVVEIGDDFQRQPTFSQIGSFMKESDTLKMNIYQSPSQAVIQEEKNQDLLSRFEDKEEPVKNEKPDLTGSPVYFQKEDEEEEQSPQFESIAHQQQQDSQSSVVDKGWEDGNDLDIDLGDEVEISEVPKEPEISKEEPMQAQNEFVNENRREEKIEEVSGFDPEHKTKGTEGYREIEEDKVQVQLPAEEQQVAHVEGGWNDDLDLDLIEDENVEAQNPESSGQIEKQLNMEQSKFEPDLSHNLSQANDPIIDQIEVDKTQQQEEVEMKQEREKEMVKKEISGWDDDDLPDIE